MQRAEMLNRVRERGKIWDILIIGGGATGVGCALDAASRGFAVLLLEQSDFGKGTSSRSTKLVHGGVRYLAQGNVSLVREALQERGILLKNAPHLVENRAFVIPAYRSFDKFFYGGGLKIYNLLAGKYNFGKSRILSAEETFRRLPMIKRDGLEGGVLYFDGQFDDSRLLINLVITAFEQGATLINYAKVFELTTGAEGKVNGANFIDEETGQLFSVKATVVINAAGAFGDKIRQMADKSAKPIIAPSQGIHLVFDKSFLPAESAMMIPKTSDGRVLFAIPWHEHALFGTTDTPLTTSQLEPQATAEEIEFILQTARNYLAKPPERKDILSVFVGIRPLVKAAGAKNTAGLSRDHTILIDNAKLLTITGGKWTTYRRMAEDAINQAIKTGNLAKKDCVTKDLRIHGFCKKVERRDEFSIYGADAEKISELIAENPHFAAVLHEKLSYTVAEIVWAVRFEMARTVEDILARRTRALFLNAKVAEEIAPQVAEIMRRELGKSDGWKDEQIAAFNQIAENYLVK